MKSFRRFLGHDEAGDFAHFVALFFVFVFIDRLSLGLSVLDAGELASPSLTAVLPLAHPVLAVLLVVCVTAVAAAGRGRLWDGWNSLERGEVLRAIAAVVAIWLAWRTSAYPFNYVLDRWHGVDRVLVLLLALGSLFRPVFLVPLVVQVRMLLGQFSVPLGTDFGQNIDDLLVMVLVAFAALHLLNAAVGRRSSSPVLSLLATAVAAHLFVPGLAKLSLDWFAEDSVSNFALNSYVAGWRGQGDGLYAQQLSTALAPLSSLLKVGTLFMELGAVVAVVHYKLLRVWLPVWASFHVLTFVLSGFFFFDWIVLELALLGVCVAPSLREWVDRNATPARGLVAAVVVLLGANVFHPPALAWLDGPIGYGYEVEATGFSGREYHVPFAAFSPFEQEMAFMRVQTSAVRLATGGYGTVSSPERLRELRALGSMEDLAAYEASLPPVASFPDPRSEQLLTAFFDHVNSGADRPSFLLSAPSRFWSGRPPRVFDFDEPLQSLRIVLVTSMTTGEERVFRRTPVLAVERGASGEAVVVRGDRSP